MIRNTPFIREICETASNMYRLGWNERNGGNISYRVKPEELSGFNLDVRREIPLSTPFPGLAGTCFVFTGTQKYFKNVEKDPQNCLGLIRISANGTKAELLWGFEDGSRPTSEITMHLGAHQTRMAIDPDQRVVVHAHPANLIAMTQVLEADEKKLTRALWGIMTECIVIFPDGVGMLDWALSSSDALGLKSAEKFRDFRLLVWSMHGITATGTSLDEAFGLMETVEKAAEIYIKVMSVDTGVRRQITDEALREVCSGFNLTVKDGWL